MPPSGQASSSSIILAWNKRAEWRIPLWGLCMEISLVNLFTEAPTGLLSQAFVYSLQLLGWGDVHSPWQPEQASLLWTLPLMPTPSY